VPVYRDPLTSPITEVDAQIESPHNDGGDADPHRDVTHSRGERQLRRLAALQGLHLVKGRDGYGLVWWEAGLVVLGGGSPTPGADLDEIDDLLQTPAAVRESWWAEWR
jgi:hypothetical protein